MAEHQIRRQLQLLGLMDDPGSILVSQNDAKALLDLVSAARRIPDDGATHGSVSHRSGNMVCDRCMVPWPCPTSVIRDVLTRLDVRDDLDPISGDERG